MGEVIDLRFLGFESWPLVHWSLAFHLEPAQSFQLRRAVGVGERPRLTTDSPFSRRRRKKGLQHFRATPCQHASSNLHSVVQAGMIQHLHHRTDGARLRVISAVNQAFEPGVNQRAGAHGARLNCSKQLAAFQAMVAEGGTGFAQRDDLGVRSGIAIGEVAVAAAADDLAVAHHHRAHRNFSRFQRALGSAESFLHEKFVGAAFVGLKRLGEEGFQGSAALRKAYSTGCCASIDASSGKPGRSGWFTKIYFPALSANR